MKCTCWTGLLASSAVVGLCGGDLLTTVEAFTPSTSTFRSSSSRFPTTSRIGNDLNFQIRSSSSTTALQTASSSASTSETTNPTTDDDDDQKLLDDAGIQLNDTVLKFAYDTWRNQFDKERTPIEKGKFNHFKTNYKNLVITNLKEQQKARLANQPLPTWKFLNEYGDRDPNSIKYSLMQTYTLQPKVVVSGTTTETTATTEATTPTPNVNPPPPPPPAQHQSVLTSTKKPFTSLEEFELALEFYDKMLKFRKQTPQEKVKQANSECRRAYRNWCKGNNKKEDYFIRFPIFASNYLAMNHYARRSGRPIFLNAYADCTLEEYGRKIREDPTVNIPPSSVSIPSTSTTSDTTTTSQQQSLPTLQELKQKEEVIPEKHGSIPVGDAGENSPLWQSSPTIGGYWTQNPITGSITGNIGNSLSYPSGTIITTSAIPQGAKPGTIVFSSSGSPYRLLPVGEFPTTETTEEETEADDDVEKLATLSLWSQDKVTGRLKGKVNNKENYDNGAMITTTAIVPQGSIAKPGMIVTTASGTRYRLQ